MTSTVPRTDLTVPAGSYAPMQASAFYEDEFYLREQAMLRTRWHYVALAASLPDVGSYQVTEIASVSVLVVRGEDEIIRAFVNVCPHRGSVLVNDASGSCPVFRCPYHAWTFGLKGELRGAPWSKEDPQFDRSTAGLQELCVESFGPFVFSTLNPAPAPLAACYGDWMQGLSPHLDTMTAWLQPYRRTEYTLDCNWKVLIENSLECYHCGPAHPQLAEMLDVRKYRVCDTFTNGLKYQGIAREGERHPDYTHPLSPGVHYLWPNIFIAIDEPTHSVIVATIRPLAVDRTIHVRDYCFGDDITVEAREAFMAFQHSIFEQDIDLCESVHRGLTMQTLARTRLLGGIEGGPRYFEQRLLDEVDSLGL